MEIPRHEDLAEKHGLKAHWDRICSVRSECFVGEESQAKTESFCGGLPAVDPGFSWPVKNGSPLHFIAQLKCEDVGFKQFDGGYLLFFYDSRNWCGLPIDDAPAVVLHQRGERVLDESERPSCETRHFFGLFTSRNTPKVHRKVGLRFYPGYSYPALDRELISFENEEQEEGYCELISEAGGDVQVGGFPRPIQSDEMEKDCAQAFPETVPGDWQLLLQLFEVGDMQWGDAGTLYWFIPKTDLEAGRLDRVRVVAQCH